MLNALLASSAPEDPPSFGKRMKGIVKPITLPRVRLAKGYTVLTGSNLGATTYALYMDASNPFGMHTCIVHVHRQGRGTGVGGGLALHAICVLMHTATWAQTGHAPWP